MESFGQYFKQLRQARALTLGQTAQRSGVSKATLSRWEASIHLPRAVELADVMDALQLTEQERNHCLRLLEMPRAMRLERLGGSGLRLALGDVLYALRQRVGKGQEEVARAVGVSRSLYRKWENSDSKPSDAQLHMLGFALGVSVEEVATLTRQALAEAPLERNREALLRRYDETDLWGVERNADSSLFLITLLAGFQSLLRQARADAGDVALILASMATEARMRYGDRVREHTLYRQAHTIALQAREPLHQRTARMVRWLLAGPAGTAPVPERDAVERALAWRTRFANKAGEAYLLSTVACSLSEVSPGTALELGNIYCALVADDPVEHPRRLRDKGNLLYHCGKPAESVMLLASLHPQDTIREGLKYLELSRSLLALNALSEASLHLERGRELLAGTEMVQIHELISELETELARMTMGLK